MDPEVNNKVEAKELLIVLFHIVMINLCFVICICQTSHI